MCIGSRLPDDAEPRGAMHRHWVAMRQSRVRFTHNPQRFTPPRVRVTSRAASLRSVALQNESCKK